MEQNITTKAKIKWWWVLLAFFAMLGIVFTTLSSFIPDLHTFQRNFKIYLHFTSQANIMGLVVALLILANKSSAHVQRLKILALVSLTITCLVFWSLIFPKRGIGEYRLFSFVGTIIVHAITPILIVVAFLYDSIKQKNNLYLRKHLTVLLLMIYPVLWLIMAIVVYYTINYSIYSFLNFKVNPVWKSIVYILGITILFVGYSYIYLYLNNRYALKNINK